MVFWSQNELSILSSLESEIPGSKGFICDVSDLHKLQETCTKIKDLMGDKNHYSATIKSKLFNNLNKIEQHKLVYKSLKGKMGNELHALSLITEGV